MLRQICTQKCEKHGPFFAISSKTRRKVHKFNPLTTESERELNGETKIEIKNNRSKKLTTPFLQFLGPKSEKNLKNYFSGNCTAQTVLRIPDFLSWFERQLNPAEILFGNF